MYIVKGYKKQEMQTRKTYKKKTITEEEVIEIKLINIQKLDEIMATPNYIELLGKKYYGDEWMCTLPETHYLKDEKRKILSNKNTKRQRDENWTPRVAATSLPIIELTLEGEVIAEWDTIKDWLDENPTKHYIMPLQCAKGKATAAYGRKWKFKN